MPMSCEPAECVKRMAMIGIRVSGSAVPTAASTLPTAPSPSSKRAPEPLDAVGEQLGGEEDDGEGGEQVDDGHGPGSLPRASYRLTPPDAERAGAGRRRPPAPGRRTSEPAAKGQERRAGRGGRTAAPPYAVKLSRC